MTTIKRTRVRFEHLLLCVGVIAALGTASAVAGPAFGTNEFYECGSCNEVNGKENFVKNNFTINHSGGGICAGLWRNNGGGNFTLLADECRGGGETAHDCVGSEVTGHGEAEAESGNGLLRGRQDNFSACE
jgi:hypothetical protein